MMLRLKLSFFVVGKRFFQGLLMGAGAILPGISGGVLSVIFGLYFPMMEILTNPKQGLKKYSKELWPVLPGYVAGFLFGGYLIALIFGTNETLACWLFLGLIAGTLPSLWQEAGKQGRSKKDWIFMSFFFASFMSILLYAQYGSFSRMKPDFWDFMFCGILWGFSTIIPGMISSSILMAVDLFEPLANGISSLDFSVIFPWLLGMLAVVISLSRLVNRLFKKHYAMVYHSIFGIILASTLSVVPLFYSSLKEFLFSLLLGILGILVGYLGERPQERI